MSESASALNAAADASRAARVASSVREGAAAVARAPRPAAPRPGAKTAAKVPAPAKPPAKPAAKPAAKPVPTGRKALTPKERASRPVTATIAAYVGWLNKEVYGGKLTKREQEIAGYAITLYGSYQVSPERRRARGV